MNYTIGLTGLQAARYAIELVGTNLANAGTEGYHRQELRLSPLPLHGANEAEIGGVRVDHVRRVTDQLLEREITRQQPQLAQTLQELSGLTTLERLFVEPAQGGLSEAVEAFFGALQELAAQPESTAYRHEVVRTAQGMSQEFNHLYGFIEDAEQNFLVQARTCVNQVNKLAQEIAELNVQIEGLALAGKDANLLRDQRDQAVNELAELADVTVTERNDHSQHQLDVAVWGTQVVHGGIWTEMEAGLTEDNEIGVGVAGTGVYDTEHRGGQVGGLLALRNEIYPMVRSSLDTLAGEIATQVNRQHVAGIGTAGSFASLRGIPVSSGAVADWTGVSPGDLRMRLIAPDGAVTVHTITIDANDTISDVAATFDAIDAGDTKFDAGAVDGALRLEGLNGYRFDFLPTREVDASGLTGGDVPALTPSGLFAGNADTTYTLTVQGDGQVGVTDGLALQVSKGGEVVKTLNVGLGYPAGEPLSIEDGLFLALGPGTLNDGEAATLEAVAEPDPTGFLAAAGINTLFQGTRARDLAVREAVLDDPSLLATARGADGNDNGAVMRMAAVGQTELSALGDLNPSAYHQDLVTNLGEQAMTREARRKTLEEVHRELTNQRDTISGVDVNDETARLLVFEQMYQAAAKFLSVQTEVMQTLMNLL